MKILKSIQYTAFVLLICAEIIYAQDFKIAPSTNVPQGSDFYNASSASDTSNGFLITWINTYKVNSIRYYYNYACRISKNGEMLDTTAILLCESYWPYYVPSADFLGGNWIIVVNQGGLAEYVGALRLTPSGEVLDYPPVNICQSTGMATILYPTIATNGQEILCVTGIAGEGLYGSIFDSDLNILADKFLILTDADANTAYRVCANGNNFFITWLNWDPSDSHIKLAIVNPEGEILSIQNVNEEWIFWPMNRGAPTITTLNNTTYITYFDHSALWIRRYSSAGNPMDPSPVKIFESPDFDLIIEQISYGVQVLGYPDLLWANGYFRFFWPGVSDPGITMMSFKPDLSTGHNQSVLLNSQCQIQLKFGPYGYDMSHSIIRASSIGDTVLAAWIDGREENPRVYGNLFDANVYTGIKQKDKMIPENFSISQNFPNPFNPSTKIEYAVPQSSNVIIKVFDILGNEIETLVNKENQTGTYEITWYAQNLPSGIYFYQLKAVNPSTGSGQGFVETKKMILLK